MLKLAVGSADKKENTERIKDVNKERSNNFRDVTGQVFDMGVTKLKALYDIRTEKGKVKWVFKCSKCSEDKDLWYEGSITAPLQNIDKRFIPCGCSRNVKYNAKQKRIMLKRLENLYNINTICFNPEDNLLYYQCNSCYQDYELNGVAVYKTKLDTLSSKGKNCNCSKKVIYNENQYYILCKRKAQKLGAVFLGWDGEFNKIYTKVKLYNEQYKTFYTFSSINKFLSCKKVPFPRVSVGTIYRGKYEVVGYKNSKVFIRCRLCHEKDPELYYKPFSVRYRNLIKDNIEICGCKGWCRWDDKQYGVLLSRVKNDMSSIIHPLPSNINSKTKIKVRCENHKDVVFFSTVGSILSRGSLPKCSQCLKEDTSTRMKKPEDYFKNKLINHLLYDLERLDGSKWRYKCHKCSNDILVKEGLCDGKFESSFYTLKKGGVGCRCSLNYQYSKDQAEFMLVRFLTKLRGKFLYWQDSYTNSESKVQWVCNKGHLHSHSFYDIHSLRGCPTCLGKSNRRGYYETMKDKPDNLYICMLEGEFIKIGRSFDVDRRVKELRNLYKGEITVLDVAKGSHDKVYNYEQYLHRRLRKLGFWAPMTWTKEVFSVECLPHLYQELSGELFPLTF